MNMQGKGLSQVHQAELEILKEIDRICRKYDISYMLDSGTLLGAVRHRGFIPWDDDADVAMTRENYEKFALVARSELCEGMEFIEPDEYRDSEAFYDFTSRIIYLNSRTHKDSKEMEYYDGKINHLWVDIFIQDNIPDGKINAALTRLIQTGIYGLAMGHRYRIDYSRYGLIGRAAVALLSSVGRHIPMETIFEWQYKVSVKDNEKECKACYYSTYQPDYFYVTVKKDWTARTVDLDFEGCRFMAPEKWHEILREVYGDYMNEPPKNKQKPTHSDIEIIVDRDTENTL